MPNARLFPGEAFKTCPDGGWEGPSERAQFDLTEPGWLGLSSHSHQRWKIQSLRWRLELSLLQG